MTNDKQQTTENYFVKLIKKPHILAMIVFLLTMLFSFNIVNTLLLSELAVLTVFAIAYSAITKEKMTIKFKLLFAFYFALFFVLKYVFYYYFGKEYIKEYIIDLFSLAMIVNKTIIWCIIRPFYTYLIMFIINRAYLLIFKIDKTTLPNNKNKLISNRLLAVSVILAIILLVIYIKIPKYNEFQRISDSNYDKSFNSHVVLNDGRVLFIDEIFDPKTEKFIKHKLPLFGTLMQLKNGKILSIADDYTSIYDLKSGKKLKRLKFNKPRSNFKAILLKNGKVLIVGGQDDDNKPIKTVEIFDPATEKFYIVGDLKVLGKYSGIFPTLIPLDDGNVLIIRVEFFPNESFSNHSFIELYNAKTAKISAVGKINITIGHYDDIYKLQNGKFIIINKDWKQSHLYNPKTGKFELTGELVETGRQGPSTAMLPDGTILVMGGFTGGCDMVSREKSTEIYDPKTNKFTLFKDLKYGGVNNVVSLKDGSVLIYNEGCNSRGFNCTKAEIFRYRK